MQLRSTAPSHLHRLMPDDPISDIYLPSSSKLHLPGRSLTTLVYSHLYYLFSLFLIKRLTRRSRGETCGAVIPKLTDGHPDRWFCECLWVERWRAREVVGMFQWRVRKQLLLSRMRYWGAKAFADCTRVSLRKEFGSILFPKKSSFLMRSFVK